MMMKISVDRDRCEGFGFCEHEAPAILRLDDAGELVILKEELAADDVPAAQAAARVCPRAALTVGET